jgi:outer membrane protein assembly factor BamB
VSGNDPLRSGWYPDQPGLNPSAGGECAFGELWSKPVNGQVYAAPLVEPDVGVDGTMFVATETNDIYGFDAVTGQQLWTRNLGPAWNPADLDPNCTDLVPSVGVTSTPAIDHATNTAYVVSKAYASGTTGPAATYAHAIDLTTGNEKPNFPVTLQGVADNDPTATFDSTLHLQRPGLLLMDGVVYAAFGGHCDDPPYRGWVMGISTQGTARVGGPITARWTDEALVPPSDPEQGKPGGGIWQAGGRLVSDKPGEILVVSGNGIAPPAAAPGTAPPPHLGAAAIRLKVLSPSGTLQPTDFWTPCNAEDLSNKDADLGSGAPLVLPDSFGTASVPHVLVVVGKDPPVYLVNRDHLGGFQQGSPGSCPDQSGAAGDDIVSRASVPNSSGVWASPALWPGDGGLFYIASPTFAQFGLTGKLNAWRVDNSGGEPVLSLAGQSNENYGFGTSSGAVTSDGTTSGSALVWIVHLPDGSGVGAELRAYDANPADGVLQLRGAWPVGQGTKFNTPTVYAGRIYVGARDGNVRAFGVTQAAAQSQPAPAPSRATNQGQGPDREG